MDTESIPSAKKLIRDYRSTILNTSGYLLVVIATLISCSRTTEKVEEDTRPNILLLVADDLGYADLGCYGGDIETPNIDALAAQGIRFSRFHTSPVCATTRAMLLTGNDNHIAGMGIQSTQDNGLGYEGRLTNRVVTIPALLKANGYHTYMAGKWHLGKDSLSNPFSKGFERSFVNLLGAGNHYDEQGLFARIQLLRIRKMEDLPNGKTVTTPLIYIPIN
jgi:arylsulfatase A-like enzyme